MDTSKVYKIVNNTLGLLHLPAVGDLFPVGIRLVPGDNNVPKRYFEAIDKLPKEANPAQVRGAVERLQAANTFIQTESGRVRGPQITILSKDADPGPEGPPLPESLEMQTESAALKLIELVDDKVALKGWTLDRRDKVAQAAKSRLALAGG